MAFLTFRQSANTTTDAQTTGVDVVRGSPLTMFEIDANFKALNDEGQAYRKKYGLGVGQEQSDNLSLAQAFNTNDANNIRNTGFYRVYNTANTPLATKSGSTVSAPNSVLIHAQSFATPTESDVTALQLTCNSVNGIQSVYFRTKQGNSTWNNWQSLATEANVTSGNTQISQLIESCVKKHGDTVTGALTIEKPVTLTGNNTIDSVNAIKGDTPSVEDYTGFTVYDKTSTNVGSTKLAYFGFNQSSTTSLRWVKNFSGVLLSASNPKETSADQVTESRLGWIPDPTGSSSTWKAFMTAPTPFTENGQAFPNLVATTGWVENRLSKWQADNQSFGSGGGTITGSVVMESTLDVVDNVELSKGLTIANNAIGSGKFAAKLKYAKPSVPTTSERVVGNGFVVVDQTAITDSSFDRVPEAARFWGQIDTSGTSTTSVEAVNWATATSEAQLKIAKISISISSDGSTVRTSAPTPPINDNSTQIATTEWVRLAVKDVVKDAMNQYEEEHPWDMGTM